MHEISVEEELQDFFRGDKYRKQLASLAVRSSKSIVVDFNDLYIFLCSKFDKKTANELTERPEELLESLERAAYNELRMVDPEYAERLTTLHVRLRKLFQITSLREIDASYIGKLVMLDGIVVKATAVKPLLHEAVFECENCGAKFKLTLTAKSPKCRHCRKLQIKLIEGESEFINFQEIRVQEKPEDLPPGEIPSSIPIRLYDDLVNTARPGDRVQVVGIVKVEPEVSKRGKIGKTFNLYIEGNYIDTLSKELEATYYITPEDEKKILELAKSPDIHSKIVRSIAPSIHGLDEVKEGIMYLLFGGVPKHMPDGVYIRGDINILLIGDPGTAKSQLLQYVARIAPRGLYTSGKGTTAAGLTASAIKEKNGGFALEAGVLVLADKGIACIDEFDKMRSEDRVAIHEAMEQQTISVAKGGIVATLNARTAILAAANPALGRYDEYRSVAENVNLPVTILSRFDLIFIIKDVPEDEKDLVLSRHILSMHERKSFGEKAPIEPELLRKYIVYAKRVNPVLTEEAKKCIEEFYLKMRKASAESSESPVAITPRQLESLIRIAEARARAALRDKVLLEDAKAAIEIMNKFLHKVGIDVSTGKVDIDTVMTGKPRSLQEKLKDVLTALMEMQREKEIVKISDLHAKLEREYGMSPTEIEKYIDRLYRDGLVYFPRPGYIKKT